MSEIVHEVYNQEGNAVIISSFSKLKKECLLNYELQKNYVAWLMKGLV